MKHLLFIVIALTLVQYSNGQVFRGTTISIMDSLRNGYRPPAKRIFDCQFAPAICSPVNKSSSAPIRFQEKGFWLESTREIIVKPTPPICVYPLYPAPSLTDIPFVNTTKGSYYMNSLGLICRQELKLDKITPVDVRFRLGSLEYVNWLERKPNATYNR